MSNNLIQQEVLIMTNTSFSNQEWIRKDEVEENYVFTQKEQLKRACWDGLAPQILPECFDLRHRQQLQLWEMNEADTFIDLEYGEFLAKKEKKFSVNPYVFLAVQDYN